ncbi:hypothetical protein BKA80DRAFT_100274 [Phyllosticta citrichinensis]
MFPRFLFTHQGAAAPTSTTAAPTPLEDNDNDKTGCLDMEGKKPRSSDVSVSDVEVGAAVPDIPARTWPQRLKLWTYYAQDRTSYWHYFKLPFYLFAFPNIVIPGFIFAFACTAGIVSFDTISKILTAPPYNWGTTSTGLLCLAALVGAIIGYATSGPLSDALVLRLARRNGGVKEPEMRLWAPAPCFVNGGAGYLLYGWGAAPGLHWAVVAVGLGGMIAQQVGASGVATAYAMDCFAGVGAELVVVLAICSSCVNFAVSYAVQPFIEAAGYGVAFTVFGALVMGSLVGGAALRFWGKRWRRMCKGRYMGFLTERAALMVQV